MLPGKKYTPDDYLRIAWNRIWIIVVPAVTIAGLTAGWAYFLPNVYRSDSRILIVPQQVPAEYVRPTVTTDLAERLQTASQQILSRTRLERIIDEFGLYEQERKTEIMEDVVEQMRRDIDVSIDAGRRNQEGGTFTVSYQAPNPRMAMRVTERLASLFVQQNLEDRELLADSTSQFLQAQLEDARRRLLEHEQKLEDFRRRNAGQLPSQVQSNLQMMQAAQTQVQALIVAAERDRDRLVVIEQAIAAIPSTTPGGQLPDPNQGDSPASIAGPAVQQLEAAKATLRQLELRLKPEHPDIVRAKRVIAEMETKAEAEALRQPLTPEGIAAAGGQPVNPRLVSLQLEAQEIRIRLETRKQEEARLNKQLAAYNGRLEASPGLESSLTELMRDYSTLQESYTTLLRRSEESKLAVNLERRQIGEQFKVLDGARLPERPVSPDRRRINIFGLLGGLGFGLGLVALLEYRDTTFKTDEDLVTSLALPVIAVIPAMITTAERLATRRRRIWIGVATSIGGVVIVGTAAAWRMGLIQNLVR